MCTNRPLWTRRAVRPAGAGGLPGCPSQLPSPITCAAGSSAAASPSVPGGPRRSSCAVPRGAGCSVTSTSTRRSLTPTGCAPGRPRRCSCRQPGLVVRRAALPESDVVVRAQVRLTTAVATALRPAAALPRDEAVVVLDRMIAARVVDLRTLEERAATRRAREVCALADGLAESPQETRLRLAMLWGGLPSPTAQYVVRDAGEFVARVDFAWPELKVAVEYDGAWHGRRRSWPRTGAGSTASRRADGEWPT